ncbi:MAG: ABC transporter permease [Flavobacteriaceae bacterium]|nr:ABC transporter permease [Flavobacteriaceae bacterium]
MKKGFLSIFKSELVRIFTTPRLLSLMLGVPLMLFVYYSSLLKEGVPRDLPITILDQDNSKLSRQLGFMLDATSSMKISHQVSSEVEGQKDLRRGDSYAFVVIPKDFQRDIQKGVHTNVMCYYNGTYLLPSGLINRDFQMVTGMFAAGAKMKTLQQGGLMPKQALTQVSPIRTEAHVLYNPYTSYSYYLNLSLMPMGLQIIIMVVSIYVFGSVLKYKRGGELLEKANGNYLVAIFGKILPYTMVFFFIGVFMNALLFYKIGIPFKGNIFILNLFFLSFIVVCQCIAFFMASVMSSLRTALTIGSSYAALAFSFAGYTFPPEGMSTFIQYFNYLFPFTSYMRFTVDFAIRGFAYNGAQKNYIIVLALFVCIGIIAYPFYAKKLKKGGYDV